MSSSPIGYGVVGLGRAGWDIHVAGLRNRADAKIVAVVDPVAERREQANKEVGATGYENLADLLKNPAVEVVVVATPSVKHGPDSKEALAAGKHVVVEKPMAMSVAEARTMVTAADQAGKKLFVHQNYRFFREFTFYHDTVQSGILGKVYHIRMYSSGFNRRNDWQTLVKNGGGVLNNTCPHFIDQALQLAGSPVKRVMGDLRQIASGGDVEDHVKIFARCENGTTIDMEVSSAQNVAVALPKWIIAGTHGTLTSDGKKATIHFFDPAQVAPLEAVDGPAANRRYGNDDKLPWQTKVVENVNEVGTDVGNFYDNVYGVVRNGAPMRVTPDQVLEVMQVIQATREGTAFPGVAK